MVMRRVVYVCLGMWTSPASGCDIETMSLC